MSMKNPGRPMPHPDWLLLGAALLLVGFGLIMVMSASGIMAEKHWDDKYLFFRKQALFALIGAAVMAAAACIPMRVFYALTYPMLILAGLLLVLTLASPLGMEAGGASRWLRLGPLSFQPLEAAKPALVFYLAYFFSNKQGQIDSFSVGFLPPVMMTGALCMLLLLQPDFGGAVILGAILFVMSVVGGSRVRHLFVSMLPAVVACWFLALHSPYRMRRLTAFLDPFQDPHAVGYQLVQSLYALGSGGLTGVGLGAGKQKLLFLPEAHNDFIMAVVGEELGFAGMSLVFMALALLAWRGFSAALSLEDRRDRLTAFGLTLTLSIQAILNMAVALGAAPPKGTSMPFISYGGSCMIMSCFCVGALLNLSRNRTTGGSQWSA